MLELAVMALAAGGVVLAHELGRFAFARVTGLPFARARFRVFVRLAEAPGRGWTRAGALLAGLAAANLAVVALAFGYFAGHGVPIGEPAIFVDGVRDGYDAAGKLAPGDRIDAVDDELLVTGRGRSLTERVQAKQGAPVTLTVNRGREQLRVTVQPKLAETGRAGDAPRWMLGITLFRRRMVDSSLTTAAGAAFWFPPLRAVDLVSGWVAVLFGSDDGDPGGPVRIVEELRGVYERQFAWEAALNEATYALLVLLVLDLFAAGALVARARRRS